MAPRVAVVTADTDAGRHVLRHSTAHVLAQAVTDLWPGARYAIGPAIEDGFYYDFELPGGQHFSEDDLARIEARMRRSSPRTSPSPGRSTPSRGAGAVRRPALQAGDHPDGGRRRRGGSGEAAGVVSAYRNTDGLRGPVPRPARPVHRSARPLQADEGGGRLLAGRRAAPAAAAHLRHGLGVQGRSGRAHLHRLEEAEKRDHRRLGAELDLFHFPPEIGGGLPVFHPKGGLIRKLMEDYSRAEHEKAGYQFVWTPHLAKSTLFEISGHLDWYSDGMYPPMEMEGATYYPKPMNCPMHILIYRARQRSYRELPLRLFEFGTVYRFERSGVLQRAAAGPGHHPGRRPYLLHPRTARARAGGSAGVRPAHPSGVRPDRVRGRAGHPDPTSSSATRPSGTRRPKPCARRWRRPGSRYVVAEGEGAFYAPKIDVHVRDAIGRRWQVSTLQVDFQMPHRFGLEYVGADNVRHRPHMIHRALFGSVERFFGILIEHYAGAFPAWLAPVQARVLPVRDDHQAYADRGGRDLRAAGSGSTWSAADEPLGARVRKAKLEKVPYVLVVGDDDVAAGTVGVNSREKERPERGVPLDDFLGRPAGRDRLPRHRPPAER